MSLRDLYNTIVERVRTYDLSGVCSPPPLDSVPPSDCELEVSILRLLKDEHTYLKLKNDASKAAYQSPDIPPGSWHMLTITSPTGSDESVIMSHHDIVIDYCKHHDIKIYLAALEKSSIWHIHYAICCPNGLGNLKRDLKKKIPHRFEVGKKCKSLRTWNGLCKYILKRDYADDTTAVKMIIEDIIYVPKKGYQIRNKETDEDTP